MSEFNKHPVQRPAVVSFVYILLVSLGGFVIVGPLIGFVLAIPWMQGTFVEFATAFSRPLEHPEVKIPFFIIQGSATLFGLIAIPLLYWRSGEKGKVSEFFSAGTVSALILVLTALTVLLFTVPNSALVEWNAGVVFPEALKGLENWARQREDYAEVLTRFLTTFGSVGEFIFAFIVIAIIPGIGEELVFRGMVQPKLQEATGNAHAAIWISAFLFSALHMQFFGFVPRLVLGALFGYLYYWSGNLIVPVFAHFVNNAFSVTMLYLHQLGTIDIDVESSEAPPWPVIISGTILTFGLLVYLKKLFDRNRILV